MILICKDKETSARLIEILKNNAFDLQISMNEKNKNYTFEFYFLDSQIALRFETGKNEATYPPLKKLNSNQIKFITTGVWTGPTPQGRGCDYDPKLMRLGIFDIGESFSQGNGVEFVAGKLEKEPSIIVLTYDDYDHIFATEADEAYNKLIVMAKSRPILEIAPVDSNKINLRIWDILVDLDVKFEGLTYSEDQLKDFLKNTNENNSFGFALGFIPSKGEKAAIASTKREGFELITLYGYNYEK